MRPDYSPSILNALGPLGQFIGQAVFTVVFSFAVALFPLLITLQRDISVKMDETNRLLTLLDNIEINIAGDDFNITLDLTNLENTAIKILQEVNNSNDLLLKQIALTNKIYFEEDGWGDSIKTKLESAESILSTVSDSIEILESVITAVSAIIEGAQQNTLLGILAALQGGAFSAKVLATIAETEFSMGASALEYAVMEAEALETNVRKWETNRLNYSIFLCT